MCILQPTGSVILSSRKADSKTIPYPFPGNNMVVPGISMVKTMREGDVNHCEFYRPLNMPAGSGDFLYDLNLPIYAVWASGMISSDGTLQFHGPPNKGVSRVRINVKEFTVTINTLFQLF